MASSKAKKKVAKLKGQEANPPVPISIHPVRDGEWLPGDEFYDEVLRLSRERADVVIDLDGVEYLDASSLQILLAFSARQKSNSHRLSITHASSALLSWFEYAGAVEQFIFA